MAYITLQELKAFIGDASTGDDDELESSIDAGQKSVENFCRRTFESSTGTRYYKAEHLIYLPFGSQYRLVGTGYSRYVWDGYSERRNPGYAPTVLWLDKDLLSIDTLTNGDGTAISSTSYWLEPRNDPPYQYIRLRTDEQWVFNTDGEISVAGTWGFSTGPDAVIKRVTKEMAAYLYKSRENPVAEVTAIPELGQVITPQGMPIHAKLALKQGGYVRMVTIV